MRTVKKGFNGLVLIMLFALLAVGCQSGQAVTPQAEEGPAQPAVSTPTGQEKEPETVQPREPADAPKEPAGMLKGVSLSPRSYEGDDFTFFLDKAAEAGDIITWAGQWEELGRENGGPLVLTTLAEQYGFIPVIMPHFFNPDTKDLIKPLDEATRQGYIETMVAFLEKHSVPYLGIGVEVNWLYQENPVVFDTFATFFDEAYDAAKAASPDTKVYTVFQLEVMKGLNGGLFGGVNDPADAHWQLLDRFPKADFLAFTSYPGIVMKTPDEIPDDYYSEIAEHTDKKVAFTELGWQAASDVPGWPSTFENQTDFVDRFFKLSAGLDREMVIWPFLFDPPVGPPFDHNGLYDDDNTPRPAWDRWLEGE